MTKSGTPDQPPSAWGVLLQGLTLGFKRVSPSHLPELLTFLIIGVIILLLAPAWNGVSAPIASSAMAVGGLFVMLAVLFRLSKSTSQIILSTISFGLLAIFGVVALAMAGVIGVGHDSSGASSKTAPLLAGDDVAVSVYGRDSTDSSYTLIRSGSVTLIAGAIYDSTAEIGPNSVAKFRNVPREAVRGTFVATARVDGYSNAPHVTQVNANGGIHLYLRPLRAPTALATTHDTPITSIRPNVSQAGTKTSDSSAAAEGGIFVAVAPGGPLVSLVIDGRDRGLLSENGKRYVVTAGRHRVEVVRSGCASRGFDVDVPAAGEKDLGIIDAAICTPKPKA